MGRTLSSRRWDTFAGRCGPLLLLTVVAGCGGAQGTVSGRVLYQNKPVPGGVVTFVPTEPGQNAPWSLIDENGHYELTAPCGEFQISVDNRELEPRSDQDTQGLPAVLPPGVKLPPAKKQNTPPPVAPQQPQGKYLRIPSKYYQIEKSGLRYTVTSGSQTHDIELK